MNSFLDRKWKIVKTFYKIQDKVSISIKKLASGPLELRDLETKIKSCESEIKT